MRGMQTVQRAARWLRSRFVKGGLILLYHRVAEGTFDPFSLCVAPSHFAEQMALLRQHAHPMPLQDLLQAARTRNLPRRAVAVTFDDGYVDNLVKAKPILDHYEIPATIFVATGYLGKFFWWDELNRCVLEPAALPERLCLIINGCSYTWTMSDTTFKSRQRILHSLYTHLQPLPVIERQSSLSQLATWSGISLNDSSTQRALTPNEIINLVDSQLIEIGAHSVTHPSLASLTPVKQEYEIWQSKVCLEEILQQPVIGFSYPYGLKHDYTPETVALVREAGFEWACTNVVDIVREGSHPYTLPRYWVHNWSGSEFSRRIKTWLRG